VAESGAETAPDQVDAGRSPSGPADVEGRRLS